MKKITLVWNVFDMSMISIDVRFVQLADDVYMAVEETQMTSSVSVHHVTRVDSVNSVPNYFL